MKNGNLFFFSFKILPLLFLTAPRNRAFFVKQHLIKVCLDLNLFEFGLHKGSVKTSSVTVELIFHVSAVYGSTLRAF